MVVEGSVWGLGAFLRRRVFEAFEVASSVARMLPCSTKILLQC